MMVQANQIGGRAAKENYAFVDVCRGIAALAVVVHHLGISFWYDPTHMAWLTGVPAPSLGEPPAFAVFLSQLHQVGPCSVAVFLIVSGFVIPISLDRYSARGFLAGRLIRIWPTYWAGFAVTVSAVLLGAWFMGGTPPFNAEQAVIHFFPPLRVLLYSKPIDGIVWTLEVEFIWYVVAAAAAPALRRGALSVFAIPVALFGLFLALWAFSEWRPPTLAKAAERLEFLLIYTPFVIFTFCGVALAYRQRGLLSRPATAAVVALCVGLFLCANATGRFVGIIDAPSYVAGVLIFAAAMAGQNVIRGGRLLNFLPRIAYPIYVVHGVAGYVLLDFLLAAGWTPAPAFALAVGFAILVAWLLHRFVETPSHRLAKSVSRALSARPDGGADRLAGETAHPSPA